MKLLALDTSTEYCSVALWLDGVLRADVRHAGQSHTRMLLPMVDALLAGAGVGLRGLDAIAVGAGPGSFTGLRIACGVAQGMALAADLPIVPVGTLVALAQASGAARALCVMDARMHEVYHAAYEREAGGWRALTGTGVCAPGALPVPAGSGWVGCGSGFAVYGDALGERLTGRIAQVKADLFPSAREIAVLGAAALSRGEARDAAEALPLYVRDKVARTMAEQR